MTRHSKYATFQLAEVTPIVDRMPALKAAMCGKGFGLRGGSPRTIRRIRSKHLVPTPFRAKKTGRAKAARFFRLVRADNLYSQFADSCSGMGISVRATRATLFSLVISWISPRGSTPTNSVVDWLALAGRRTSTCSV
jgi:hypothetical protein